MPDYLVKQPLKFDSDDYDVGETVTMSTKQAESLLSIDVLEEKKATKAEKPSDAVRLQQIIDAVASLDKDDADLWTNSGKAQVAAIEAVLGFDISAKERDAALASIEKTGAAE